MYKILIVEDDKILAKMYQSILAIEKYNVVTVETGDKALQLIKSFQPDLILLDIMLPGGLNGFDIMEQLRKDSNLGRIPVIIITNLDSERKTAMDMGAKEYILKAEKNPNEVVRIINQYLKKPAA